METLISGKNMVLGYAGKALGEASSFEVPKGKVTALIGCNGAGKSTLLKALTGERCLISGELSFESKRIEELKARELSQRLAYVAQEHQYIPELRVRDFLRLAYLPKTNFFKGLPDLSDADRKKVSALGIDTFLPRTLASLSSGERQRIFLARAILQGTQCLLLDEPTNHLDPPGIIEFWDMLLKSGNDCIVSTHDLSFVKNHATWVCVLHSGKVIYSGVSESLWKGNTLATAFGEKWWAFQSI